MKILERSLRLPALTIFLIIFILTVSCGNTYRDDLLNGNFGTIDKSSPGLLNPQNETTVINKNLSPFLWTNKTGIIKYKIQIAEDENFKNIILDKIISDSLYQLNVYDLKGITELEAIQYFWRVASINGEEEIFSETNNFYVLDENIVYADSNSVKTFQNGSKSAPFKTIQTAIANAEARRNYDKDTPFHIYIAEGTYNEEVTLVAGISLWGGYDLDTWDRDIKNNVSIIQSPNDKAIRANSDVSIQYTETTIIDGLTIDISSTNQEITAIYLNAGSPTIQNNVINVTGTGNFNIYGIQENNSAAKLLNNVMNVIQNAGYYNTTGIELNNSEIQIKNNLIFVQSVVDDPGSNNYALKTVGFTGSVENNIFFVDDADMYSYGFYISAPENSNPVFSQNTIYGFGYTVSHNSLAGSYTNNILFGGSSYVFREPAVANSDPFSFSYNLLFNASTLYYNEGSVALNDPSDSSFCAALTAPDGFGYKTTNCTGNLGDTSTTTTTDVFDAGFVDLGSVTSADDLKTWAIKANGPADLDSSGNWTFGDIGADAEKVGPGNGE